MKILIEKFNEKINESAFKKLVEYRADGYEPHFVYASEWYKYRNLDIDHYYGLSNDTGSSFRGLMEKYQFKSVMATTLFMQQINLITKERMKSYCFEEDPRLKKSVNDDLEKLFEDLKFGKIPVYFLDRTFVFHDRVDTYFLPQLTENEMTLIEQKDHSYFQCFYNGVFGEKKNPDVNVEEMKMSDSRSKFNFTECRRTTYRIDLDKVNHTLLHKEEFRKILNRNNSPHVRPKNSSCSMQ